jgi:hypothetical protein
VGGLDLNREMVARGQAWAFVKYSKRYSADEAVARARRLGVWQSNCTPAWSYREARWRSNDAGGRDSTAGACPIKGNITARGRRVYHVPWGRWYQRTRIDVARGERWVCSESEAIEAGWRRSAS